MRILASGLQYPEGPVAMPDGSVLLVEIARQTLVRVDRDGRVDIVARVPGGPNGAAVGPDGRIFVCNNGGLAFRQDGSTFRSLGQSPDYRGGSIDVVDSRTGRVERLYDRCGRHPLRGPNDLVFDGQGGFWFTDFGKRRDRDFDRGFVYWARADGSEIREVIPRMFQPNGIGISPDGQHLYVAETHSARLWSFEIVAPGEIRPLGPPSPYGGRLVAGPGGYLQFDSLAVTDSGAICIATGEGAGIIEISADGAFVRQHAMPDTLVTNICFGGADMRTAFITLGYRGELIALDWHEPGLMLHHQQSAVR
jgi:gluconolactonase